MAAVSSLSFSVIGQTSGDRKVNVSSARYLASNFQGFRFHTSFLYQSIGVRVSTTASASASVVHCMSNATGKLIFAFQCWNLLLGINLYKLLDLLMFLLTGDLFVCFEFDFQMSQLYLKQSRIF